MHVQDPNGRLFAVDARDDIAQRVTNEYDAADNRRFFLVRASNAAQAIAFARELNAAMGWHDYTNPHKRIPF